VRGESLDGRRWIGRVLRDKWRIDARISRGGVGTVYAATHKNNGSRAAIKVLHPEFSRDVDTRSRFLQEGYAANQVNHPGVVRILDDDTSETVTAYLVMELLEGELLETRRIRKGGRLPLSDVYEVGEQLLDVLAAAHEKGIVHRDIKPDNLFITHEGRLKVLDFGFAQMKSSFRTEQTATGFLLGTPGFMSPEQAIGNRPQIDAQTDIWAVGATLFTLISGEPVHAGESAAEMLVAAANFPPRSLATVTNGLNPRLVSVVDRALAFDKANRWPNARSMQFALREAEESRRRDRSRAAASLTTRPTRTTRSRSSIPTSSSTQRARGHPRESIGRWWRRRMCPPMRSRAPSRARYRHPRPARARIPPTTTDRRSPSRPPTTDPSELAPPFHSEPPQTPHMGLYPGGGPSPGAGMVDAVGDGGTLIMESPAAAHDDAGGAYPPISRAPTTAPKPFGQTLPLGQQQQHQQFHDPRGMSAPRVRAAR